MICLFYWLLTWTNANTIFKPFSKVFVQDATKFSLPSHLQKDYPGYGGCAPNSAGQVQFTYELKNQQIYQADLYAATRNECLSATANSWIEQGALILRDLGYFSIEGFKEIIAKGAYFISRAKPKTSFFKLDNPNERVHLKQLVHKMTQSKTHYHEQTLIMGWEKSKKLKVRVIICKVPDPVREQRLRKAYKNAKQRNWTVKDQYKLWAAINVFITNVSNQQISAPNIPLAYKLRWQIELIFKTWKSHYKIHLHKAVCKQRIECYLYASLLLIILQNCIFSWLQHLFARQQVWLSMHKFSKIMYLVKDLFHQAITTDNNKFNQLVSLLLALAKPALVREKKKGKIGFKDIISHNLCVY